MIYSESQAQKHLLENNRDYKNRLTWQNAIQGVNAQAQNAQAQLAKAYVDASADAYTSYLKSQNALKSSDIVGLGRQNLLEQNNLALQDAYNTYAQNLSEGQAKIENSRLAEMEQISSALEQQAKYTADYTNAHIDYLKELYRQYEEGENQLFDDPEWARYLEYTTPTYDSQGNVVYDENGNIVYDQTIPSLISDKNLMSMMYDESGLTLQGMDIFDQLEHQIAQAGYGGSNYSWSDYLAETNPKLLEWANTYNPYNYTPEGTNASTLNTMYGMASDDYTYRFAERFGGADAETLEKGFDEVRSTLDSLKLNGKALGIGNTTLLNELSGQVSELLTNTLKEAYQLSDAEIAEIGVDASTITDEISSKFDELVRKYAVDGKITTDSLDSIARELETMYKGYANKATSHIAKIRRDEEIAFNNRTGK